MKWEAIEAAIRAKRAAKARREDVVAEVIDGAARVAAVRMTNGDARAEKSGRIQRVRVNQLRIDPTYQSTPNQKKIDEIARAFDPDKAGVCAGSLRRDGLIYVCDGQHRVLGARDARVEYVWMEVRTDLDIAGEAAWAVELNEKRRAHFSAGDLYRLKLRAGDEDALDVQRIATEEGFRLSLRNRGRGVTEVWNAIGAVRTLLGIHEKLAPEYLQRTLVVVRTAARERHHWTDGRILSAVAETIWLYGGPARHPSFSDAKLGSALSKADPTDLTMTMKSASKLLTGSFGRIAGPASRAAITAAYNRGLHAASRLPEAGLREYKAIQFGKNPWLDAA